MNVSLYENLSIQIFKQKANSIWKIKLKQNL